MQEGRRANRDAPPTGLLTRQLSGGPDEWDTGTDDPEHSRHGSSGHGQGLGEHLRPRPDKGAVNVLMIGTGM